MGLNDLTGLALEQVGLDTVQDSRLAESEGGRVSVGLDSCKRSPIVASVLSTFLRRVESTDRHLQPQYR